MTSWIKLDKSFSEIQERGKRIKTHTHNNGVTSLNIEDDSSQDSSDSDLSLPTKKRKLRPLENVTIEKNVSDESSCEVEYNPDGAQLPYDTKTQIKPTLPMESSTSTSLPHRSSTDSKNTANAHSSKSWLMILQQNENNNLSNKIEDSISDEDLSNPDTLIDESSTDSSMTKSQRTRETAIETQDSITPPVEPFLTSKNNVPKKRKVRMVKGGMVERLTKCLSQAKSNISFWHHHRSAELIEAGTLITVNKVEHTFGRTLIHTTVIDVEIIFCLCSRSLEVKEGDIIEVNFDISHSYRTDTQVLYAYVDKAILIKGHAS